METDNSETNKENSGDELDEIIKKEAEEYTQQTRFLPQKEEPYLQTPKDAEVEQKKLGNRRQKEPTYIDDKTIQAEAKEGLTHEAEYLKFKEELPAKISNAYNAVFKEHDDETADARQTFMNNILVHHDGRYLHFLQEGEQKLEDKIREYTVRTINQTASEPLNEKEQQDYSWTRAIISMSKALDNPTEKRTNFREARMALHDIGLESVADSIDELYKILQTIEQQ
ncbi:hypothetical protein HY485_00865 [Candidatus Woesearchaeota archaeon]|nr:hypothetical protein [Candidatus Woesearchaeota archaeon]